MCGESWTWTINELYYEINLSHTLKQQTQLKRTHGDTHDQANTILSCTTQLLIVLNFLPRIAHVWNRKWLFRIRVIIRYF